MTRVDLGLALATAVLAGCFGSHSTGGGSGGGGSSGRDGGPGSGVDGGPGGGGGGTIDGAVPGHDAGPPPVTCRPLPDQIDVLFVVDNSGTMAEEQALLHAQVSRFLGALLVGDVNGDGAQDFAPFRSIHAGVVSTDMGSGGHVLPTCTEPRFGDDGVLQTDASDAWCMPAYPSFWSIEADSPIMEALVGLQCTSSDTGGCGYEQPLEAALKAVTTSASPITFFGGTVGHADGRNAGFARPGAMLAVIVVSDEEDCSAADPSLFDPYGTTYPGDFNLRCFLYPGAVHPVERYVEGLLATRAGRPDLLLFGVIAGLPADLAFAGYDAMLADPRMQEQIDPSMPTRLRPSCNTPGVGVAYPPRRLVQTAAVLSQRNARTSVGSLCEADFTRAFDGILAAIARPVCY